MSVRQFDIVVIGLGPGGEGAAMKAARSGKRVCMVEQPICVSKNSFQHPGLSARSSLRVV